MPTPQTSIAIDKTTKNRAAKRAKQENIPLATVVRILLVDYANGNIHIGTRTEMDVEVREIPVDKSTQKQMDTLVEKWRDTVSS